MPSTQIERLQKQRQLFFASTNNNGVELLKTFIHSAPFEQRVRSLAGIVNNNNKNIQHQSASSSSTVTNLNNGQLIVLSHHDALRRERDGQSSSNQTNNFKSIAETVSSSSTNHQHNFFNFNTNSQDDEDQNGMHDDDNNDDITQIKIDINPEELKAKSNQQKNKSETETEKITTSKNANLKFKVFRKVASDAGTMGKVTALAVDRDNTWFGAGSSDGAVRAYDLATGRVKFTFASRHIGQVRAIAISALSPYMFTAGEDKLIKCWDLERNEIIREYQGHLSAVYAVETHPRQDIIVSGGRDATVRVWDVRSRNPIHILSSSSSVASTSASYHTDSVMSLATQEATPQLVSGGADGLIFLWDLGTGRPITRLTRHKKPVRALLLHPTENTMVSVGADAVRKWRVPIGEYMGNLTGSDVLQNLTESSNSLVTPSASSAVATTAGTSKPLFDTVWNTASYSPLHDCFVVGSESGNLLFADWASMKVFYETKTKDMSSSKDAAKPPPAVICCSFDRSGGYLLTGEGDKTITHWREKVKE